MREVAVDLPTVAEFRPFRIQVPEADLEDLRERLARTRWPDRLPGLGWDDGVPLAYLRELAEYWRTSYDWRKHEARLNELLQFTTEIDGTNVHFVHARSSEPDALPLLITHGWPGSIVELAEIIGPLSDPRAHGGDPADSFHVVAPSIPGFAFSGPTRGTGWGLRRITEAFAALMGRLGYERYGAHGGDFGALLSPELGRLHPDRVVGVHVNGFLTRPPRDPAQLAELSEEERRRVEAFTRFWRNARGYAAIQATRPQTVAYALTDSPVGQLAWIVEKFKEWTDSSQRPEDAVDRDQLLTNVTVYWLTATAGSSARLYKKTATDLARSNEPSTVPTGMAVSRGSPPCPSDGSSSAPTTSCTGPSSTGAATSRRWKCPTCSSATCARSSAASARVPMRVSTQERDRDETGAAGRVGRSIYESSRRMICRSSALVTAAVRSLTPSLR